jgi:sugar (pentulose or hexulose) kinase
MEQADSVAGQEADSVAVGGGMIQTRLWVEILASVLGRPILVPPRPQATATGAYLCAATALGDFGSLEEAAAAAVEDLETVQPDDLDTADYMGHYERWVEVREQTEAIEL